MVHSTAQNSSDSLPSCHHSPRGCLLAALVRHDDGDLPRRVILTALVRHDDGSYPRSRMISSQYLPMYRKPSLKCKSSCDACSITMNQNQLITINIVISQPKKSQHHHHDYITYRVGQKVSPHNKSHLVYMLCINLFIVHIIKRAVN